MKWFYEWMYKNKNVPWDIGPRKELVELIESGQLKPGRAIDLGCGTGSNSIFMAQHGFEVTGIDYSNNAIAESKARLSQNGVQVDFFVDDLTDLQRVKGPYDLLVDYGTLDDLRPKDRDLYMQNVLPLTHPGSTFLLYTFEWKFRWWERLLFKVAFFGAMALEPGEVQERFGPHFEIEKIVQEMDYDNWPPGYCVYLMKRK